MASLLTHEERVHMICKLLTESRTTDEICQMVEHAHLSDPTFKSLIIGIRTRRVRKDISDLYEFETPSHTIKNRQDEWEPYRKEIAEMIEAHLDSKTIVGRLYKPEMACTEKEFAVFVANYRAAYTNKHDHERVRNRKNSQSPMVIMTGKKKNAFGM